MFSYLKGILVTAQPNNVVIDVHGIGYYLFTPCSLMSHLPSLGQPIQLYTTFVVRESSQALYGFLNSQDRDVFELLMNVSGIGPKLALSLIGHLTCEEMERAVIEQDLPTLCKVPGVGKKTAERLVVELKDKLPTIQSYRPVILTINSSDQKTKHVQDAMLALINLGYSQIVAQKAVKKSLNDLQDTADLALLITTALKNI